MIKTSLHIRVAKPEDTEAIVRLVQEHAAIAGEQSLISASSVATYLAFEHNGILLAEREGQIIGLVSYSIRPDLYHAANVCLIEELIVESEWRGHGVGHALMTELLDRLGSLECVEVSVAVGPDNSPPISLYQSQGLTDEALLLEKHF
jgi:N-acetylglutamate synthase-like GNAT family acetyltransferase